MRFVAMMIFIAVYAVVGIVGRLLCPTVKLKRKYSVFITQKASCLSLSLMGASVRVAPFAAQSSDTNLIVANHMSYIDVLILASIKPCLFVTSVEIQDTLGLGLLASVAGSLFIERRHRERLSHDIRQIKQALNDGFNVVLFPEGTSSNGESVLPFKKGLLKATAGEKINILPLCLNYAEINHRPFSVLNRDFICWYGDMDFMPHFYKLMTQVHGFTASVETLEPQQVASENDVKFVADEMHRLISTRFQRINI